jgi:hypothetical protein
MKKWVSQMWKAWLTGFLYCDNVDGDKASFSKCFCIQVAIMSSNKSCFQFKPNRKEQFVKEKNLKEILT